MKKPVIQYSGGDRSLRGGALTVERVRDGLKLSVNASLSPPSVMAFSDHVELAETRDGVDVLFGKTNSFGGEGALRSAVQVSIPYRSFCNHMYKSVIGAERGRSFRDAVDAAIVQFGLPRIDKLEAAKSIERVQPIRANFASMALHEDDAAVDFFHLDANSVQAVLHGKAPELRGIVRIVLSPTLLLYFLDALIALAERIRLRQPKLVVEASQEGT